MDDINALREPKEWLMDGFLYTYLFSVAKYYEKIKTSILRYSYVFFAIFYTKICYEEKVDCVSHTTGKVFRKGNINLELRNTQKMDYLELQTILKFDPY